MKDIPNSVQIKCEKVKINNELIQISEFINFGISKKSKYALPKSGVHFVEVLKKINFNNKKVLDIGTGYYGYLARHIFHFGAKSVLAVDIDKKAIENAKKINKIKGLDFKISDVFSNVGEDDKFDIIVSNPPQLPTNNGGDIHDVSGFDGLTVINQILNGFSKYTIDDGTLYLLAFDFLFDKIKEECDDLNLFCKKITYYEKHIREEGQTAQRAEYIESIYPNFRIKKNNRYYHNVYILKINKK